MALGGVATGSMKANEALRVHGTMTYRGFIWMDWDCQQKKETLGVVAVELPVVLLKDWSPPSPGINYGLFDFLIRPAKCVQIVFLFLLLVVLVLYFYLFPAMPIFPQ